MKFRYGYRTKDNKKVEGIISAASREDVYAQLKREGRKPYMVEPLPGLWNKVTGIGKRGFAIIVLAIVCVALAIAVGHAVLNAPQPSPVIMTIDSTVRRQVIGDAAIIDRGIRTGWADVFALEGERFLASFAVPGTAPAVRSTTEEEIKKALDSSKNGEATSSSLQQKDQSIEARQIRAMVTGMKQELREFIADGGTIRQYGKRLVQRQEEEIAYYNRAKAELDRALKDRKGGNSVSAVLDRYNPGLRRIGVRPLVLPE